MDEVQVNLVLLRIFAGAFFKHYTIAKRCVSSRYRKLWHFLNFPNKTSLSLLALALSFNVGANIDYTDSNIDDNTDSNIDDNTDVKEGVKVAFLPHDSSYKLSFTGFSVDDLRMVETYLVQHSGYSMHKFEVLEAFNALVYLNIQTDTDELVFILEKILSAVDLKAHIITNEKTISVTMIGNRTQERKQVPKGVW